MQLRKDATQERIPIYKGDNVSKVVEEFMISKGLNLEHKEKLVSVFMQ